MLINGFKTTKDAAFSDLVKDDLSIITKEEFDYFIKFRDFEHVKQYEKLIHSVAVDVPVYGRIYFKTDGDVYKLDNELKLEPFTLDAKNPEYTPALLDKTEQLFDYNVENYYIPGASRDVINNIKMVIMSRFELSPVWRIDLLI